MIPSRHPLSAPPGQLSALPSGGVLCPACGSTEHQVRDSRPIEGGIRRRRRCRACQNRFTTYEVHGLDKVTFADLLQFDAMLSRLDPEEIALLRAMLQRFLRDKGVT